MKRLILLALLSFGLTSTLDAAHHAQKFTTGTPDYGSLGTLSFGPENVLFIGDSQNGQILAIRVNDGEATMGEFEVVDIDEKIAAMVGTRARDVQIHDMAVNPASGFAYLSVARGNEDILMRALPNGNVEHVPLENVSYAMKSLSSVVSKEKKNRRGRSPISFSPTVSFTWPAFPTRNSHPHFASWPTRSTKKRRPRVSRSFTPPTVDTKRTHRSAP